MEIQRYWAVIWKWLWLIIIGVVVAGGISYFLSQRMEPVYRATATLIVYGTTNSISGYEYSQPAVTTHADLIKQRSVMEGVIDELGINYSPGELMGKISVGTKSNTPIIEVSAEHTDKVVAQQIANTTVNVYIEQHQEKLIRDGTQSLSIIQGQISQLEAIPEADRTDAQKNELSQLKLIQVLWTREFLEVQAAQAVTPGESASLPTSPVSPKTTQNVIMACILGLVVTTGGAFLKEWLDRSVRTAEDISQLTGLSTLGAVAKFKSNPGEKGGLIAEAHPRSSVAEAFRMLRTNLQFASIDKPAQTLLVTSAAPRDGKTSVVANLAVSIAQTGKKVIAVDTDLRHPELHELLELPNTIGFSNLLLAEQPDVAGFLQPTKVEGLRVLTAGPHSHSPAELLGSPRISFLVEKLKKEADIILFDSAPVLAVADTTILAAKVDGAILVVAAGRTRPEALTETKEALSKGNANILGAVLNHVEMTGRGSYYYHYRYPHYYYGEEGEKKRHRASASQGFSKLLKRFTRK